MFEEVELKEIIQFKNGKKRPKEEGQVPVYGGNGVLSFTNESNYSNCIIVGRVGAYCGSVYYSEDECWVSDNAIAAIPKKGTDTLFAYYLLKRLNLNNHRIGSSQPLLTQGILNGIRYPVPDEETQRRISSVLSTIDYKITTNEAINRNLLVQAVAIYSDMIFGKEKNGTIGDYCAVKSGFAFKSAWWTDSGVKVIKIGDINQDNLNLNTCSYVDEDKIDKAKEFKVFAGDLVLAMTGATIGKFAMVPERNETILVNQRVGKFFLGDKPLQRIPFIYCTLKQDDIYSEIIGRGQGSAQPNISATDILTIPCVMPTKNEIDDFNELVCPLFTRIVKTQNENEQLANLRDSLLPKLLSGELEVSKLDI